MAVIPAIMTGVVSCMILTELAHAQEVPPDPSQSDALLETYSPEYFAVFKPETARDMVAQIPGFTLQVQDDQRGFGEADSNLLINDQRPSTKSQNASEILSQIPAGAVLRIEILDGASLDIPGLSGQVVNVIARAVELSGNWNYAARFEEGTEPQVLEGGVNISGTRGNLDFALSLNAGQFTFSEDGTEIFFENDGVVFEDRREDIQFDQTAPSARLNLKWAPVAGPFANHVANVNLSVDQFNRNVDIRETFTALTPLGRTGQSEAVQGIDREGYEIGGDYAVPFGPGTLKFIGLLRERDEDVGTVFVRADNGNIPMRVGFFTEELTDERIARTEYLFKAGSAHNIQISGEYAFNALDSTIGFQMDLDPIAEERVRVEEDRFEGRVSDSWQISKQMSLQTSLGAEFSRLQVVTPLSEAREFFRPKGFAALSYQLSKRYSLRARLERGVGQLDFSDFVSTRSLADDRVSSGNSEIKPDQFWEMSVELERTSDRDLSGSLRPYLRIVEDPIDRVLFADGTEGPGNLDDNALLYGLEANATLLMNQFGAPGLRFEFDGAVGGSEIDDPLTGETRQISNALEWEYEVEARYDIPETPYALTAEVESNQFAPFYRFDEIQDVNINRPYLSIGFLHKDIAGLQVQIEATNLLDNVIERRRPRFLTQDLRLAPPTFIEEFGRKRGRRLSIEISGTF